jgi:hypothetical protein
MADHSTRNSGRAPADHSSQVPSNFGRVRLPSGCPARLHGPGFNQSVMIVDFTNSGFGLDCAFGLADGVTVSVEVLTGMCLEGQVRWVRGRRAGIALARALPPFDLTLIHLQRLANSQSPKGGVDDG